MLARTVSKVTGYTVVLIDSSNAKNGKAVNGRKAIGEFNSTKGEIVLDIGEGNVAATSLHESVHYIRINAPEEFNAMAKYVVEWLTRNGVLEEYLDRYASSYKLDNIYDLTEEMTADVAEALLKNADFVEDLFTDESFVKEICGENRTFAEKFVDALKSIIEAIKNYLKSGDVNHLIAGKISEDAKALEEIKNLWEEGLKAAVDNHAKSSAVKQDTKKSADKSGKKYSIIDEMTDTDGNEYNNVVKLNYDIFKGVKPRYWSKNVSDFIESELIGKTIPVEDEIGNTEYIEFAGMNERVKKDGANNAHKVIDKLKRKSDNNSKLVIVNLQEITRVSELKNKTDENSHQWLDENGWEYRSAYIVSSNGFIYSLTLNIAKSRDGRNILYDVNNIKKVGQASLLSQTAENDSRFGLPHSNFEVTEAPNTNLKVKDTLVRSDGTSAEDSVSQSPDKVNTKFSITELDSDGNKLSEQQKEYFKDSKVVDEKGNLLVMYHGTSNANFTKFKSGSYFTQNKNYADNYKSLSASSISVKKSAENPDIYTVYLNITKPFDTRNKKERDIFINEYYRKYGTGAPLSESGLPDWTDGLDLQEFIEEMGYNYDGLILDEGATGGYGDEVVYRGLSYVTFNANQIKNTNNVSPSDSDDIRFSLSELSKKKAIS